MSDHDTKKSTKTYVVNMSKKALHDALWDWAYSPDGHGIVCSSIGLQKLMDDLYKKPRPKKSPTP